MQEGTAIPLGMDATAEVKSGLVTVIVVEVELGNCRVGNRVMSPKLPQQVAA